MPSFVIPGRRTNSALLPSALPSLELAIFNSNFFGAVIAKCSIVLLIDRLDDREAFCLARIFMPWSFAWFFPPALLRAPTSKSNIYAIIGLIEAWIDVKVAVLVTMPCLKWNGKWSNKKSIERICFCNYWWQSKISKSHFFVVNLKHTGLNVDVVYILPLSTLVEELP